MENETIKANALKRSFGMKEAVTITVGTVIGVGLFTTGGNIVGSLGAAVILATLAAMIISVYPALLYAEMGASLPYAGGTYQYASLGLNKPLGMLAGWNFVISLVAVTSGEALAFSFYFRTLFSALGITLPVNDVVIACIAVAIFMITNVRGVEMTGKLQNGFMFFFWGVAIIWFLSMIPNVQMPNFVVLPPMIEEMGTTGFIAAVAMIWWCFAGFETCCAMGEEIKYPQINIPRALFLAPFIVFVVNASFQWFLVGIVPLNNLGDIASSTAPYADAMISAGILGLPLIMLAAGIAFGGDFSTMNASIAVPPRYLYTMARDGSIPRIFAKIHPKYQTPYVAILVLGFLTIFLVASNSLIYIASLSLFADLFYYVIGIAAALGLRIKNPDLPRPYKAPFIKIGVPISIIIYVVMITQLNREAMITGVIWSALGLLLYIVCRKKYGNVKDMEIEKQVMVTEVPDPQEKAKMDKVFKIWSAVVAAGVVIVVLMYAIPFFVV